MSLVRRMLPVLLILVMVLVPLAGCGTEETLKMRLRNSDGSRVPGR